MSLAARFPLTAQALSQATLDHVVSLEHAFSERRVRVRMASDGPRSERPTFDVALAGGGASLLYGVQLARAGYRVLIFDRRRIGTSHREWNISRRELEPLIMSGLFGADEVARLVLAEYERGVVRWHGGQPHVVRGVLDCAIDAQGLLDRLRAFAVAAGATLLDGNELVGYHVGPSGVTVDLEGGDGQQSITTRLLLDATGAASPHAAFDLVCPTVGGTLSGLAQGTADNQVDPRVGEILISTEHVEESRQHIWEGFPGAGGRFTAYLFYYAEPKTLEPHPLLSLYERFFRLRPRYKRGDACVEKATYGFIPAYTRLRPRPVSPADRVLLVGDAAGRHSPLTFCGFGSLLRSFLPIVERLRPLLGEDRLGRRHLAKLTIEPAGLRVMGGLTLMMLATEQRRPGGRSRPPEAVNELLDAAFASLAELGEDVYAAFVRDEIGARDFLRFMIATARKRPTLYREVYRQLSAREMGAWAWQLAGLAASKWVTGREGP